MLNQKAQAHLLLFHGRISLDPPIFTSTQLCTSFLALWSPRSNWNPSPYLSSLCINTFRQSLCPNLSGFTRGRLVRIWTSTTVTTMSILIILYHLPRLLSIRQLSILPTPSQLPQVSMMPSQLPAHLSPIQLRLCNLKRLQSWQFPPNPWQPLPWCLLPNLPQQWPRRLHLNLGKLLP